MTTPRDEAAIDALIRECGGMPPSELLIARKMGPCPHVHRIPIRDMGRPAFDICQDCRAKLPPECGHMNPAPEAEP